MSKRRGPFKFSVGSFSVDVFTASNMNDATRDGVVTWVTGRFKWTHIQKQVGAFRYTHSLTREDTKTGQTVKEVLIGADAEVSYLYTLGYEHAKQEMT